LNHVVATIVLVVFSSICVASAQDAPNTWPRFRATDVDAPPITTAISVSPIRLLADQDFAPWSFTLDDGTLTGISVELARAACTEAGLTCNIVATPHDQLLQRLDKGEGEMIITGLKLTDSMLNTHNATKPYFRSIARFMMAKGTELKALDPRSLAGMRLGVVKNTAHHAFLLNHYSRSALIAYDSPAAFFAALKQKQIDVGFGDAMAMAFWSASPSALDCCETLGGAVLDVDTFSRPLVFLARQDLIVLRDRIDDALDSLENKGQTAALFLRFLPAPIW
jgi:polar amino acid transport system substrate-binding protein